MQRCVAVLLVAFLMFVGVACAPSAYPVPSPAPAAQAVPVHVDASLPGAVQLQSTSASAGLSVTQPVGRATVDGTGSDAVLAAALVIFDAVPMADCQTNNPLRKQCVDVHSGDGTSRGIVTVTVGDAAGIGGFTGVLGLDANGDWRNWFGTQNSSYHLLNLPGRMIVCAGGDALNVRSAADSGASVAGMLPDRTPVTAEQFTLTQPGQGAQRGSGWYRLSEPLQGWASSEFLSDASNDPNCQIHDIQTSR